MADLAENMDINQFDENESSRKTGLRQKKNETEVIV